MAKKADKKLDGEIDEECAETGDVLKDMVANLDALPTDVLKQLLKNLEELEEWHKNHPDDEFDDDDDDE